MNHDQETPISLMISDSPLELQVITFSGHEALNQPYRFDIDLISATPDLDVKALESRCAFLSFGTPDCGIHGLIGNPRQLHVGRGMSHYRVHLQPRLCTLQQRRHRRIFQGLSAPQIVIQLLEEHGIDDAGYRFEHPVGLYPPRESCTQYDESDLHLLQRLCEEEGIHYRFEHSHSDHLLVFADDPASFPEQITPTRFYMDDGRPRSCASISHMAERFSIRPSYSSHDGLPYDRPPTAPEDHIVPPLSCDLAANQPCDAVRRFDQQSPDAICLKQSSERRLERLRCERRQVHGHSNQPTLVSGQILRVEAHPDNLFNDQWLVTKIHHAGQQPQLLKGFDPVDIVAIISQAPSPNYLIDADIAPFRRGYRNHFQVIPWAMPFRPPLTHGKPQVQGYDSATLMGNVYQPVPRDEHGRVQVRFHWQPLSADANVTRWLPMVLLAPDTPLIAGTHVRVGYFDNDPDRPVICEVLEDVDSQVQPQVRIDGLPMVPVAEHIHLSAGQTLQASAHQELTLSSPHTCIEISDRCIRITAPQTLASATSHGGQPTRDNARPEATCQEDQPPYGPACPPSQPDLSRLFQWLAANCP